MLVVTNGTAATAAIERAGIATDLLAWEDVLHDGPVPADLDLGDLSLVRARFIADQGWGTLPDVTARFHRRDERLTAAVLAGDEIVLWFEHDLYDQLQLLQLLDWSAEADPQPYRLSLICTDQYVSLSAADALHAAFEARVQVTEAQVALARRAWAAFRNADPRECAALGRAESDDLPFLAPALRRFCEEYPWRSDGLGKTERRTLETLHATPGLMREAVFARVADEEPRYLGDTSFYRMLDALGREPGAMVEVEPDGGVQLTRLGEDVVNGRVDRLRVRGLDRWLGGARLTGGSYWRWNPLAGSIERD